MSIHTQKAEMKTGEDMKAQSLSPGDAALLKRSHERAQKKRASQAALEDQSLGAEMPWPLRTNTFVNATAIKSS